MKALLVYPAQPSLTYWSFRELLPFIKRRATHPPLGLITLAALLPRHWELRLVDENVTRLGNDDLLWADVVMTSTMVVQAEALDVLVARAHALGKPVVAGGPYPSGSAHRLAHVDHVFVGEAEAGLGGLLEDLEAGTARHLYEATGRLELAASPTPRFDLLDVGAYASMAIQHSRGCPYSCEFCDIWKLYGRRPRVKEPAQLEAELDAIHATGYRGTVFFVDDNFIGNPGRAKRSLRAIHAWQQAHGFPFTFYTEASINLAADDELMRLMRDAGFNFVFLGIETPSVEALVGANKPLNAKLDLLASVERIQSFGIEVSSGFIVGFDQDGEDVFDRQVEFIDRAGIPIAMVGILTALEGTELHARLAREGRLLSESSGNNTHSFEPNFVPTMPKEALVEGYKRMMSTLYAPSLSGYFERCRRLLDRLGPNPRYARSVEREEIAVFLRSLCAIFTKRWGLGYARFLAWCALHHRPRIAEAVRLSLQGHHFAAITREALASDAIGSELRRSVETFWARVSARVGSFEAARAGLAAKIVTDERARVLRRLRRRLRRLPPEARRRAAALYADALSRIDASASEIAPRIAELAALGERRLETLRRYLDRQLHRGEEVRATLRTAKRAIKRLPREYRLLGRLALSDYRRRLDELAASGCQGRRPGDPLAST